MTRRLPPLNAVRAFEACARHSSVTRAAQELCVTQGAVSRQVAALEDRLAVKLVVRTPHGIKLTPCGRAYYETLRQAFDQIETGTRKLHRHAREHTLRLSVTPTFALRWLVPRLARFLAAHRNIDVQISTSHTGVDFRHEDFDAAIHSDACGPNAAEASSIHQQHLFGEVVMPVCSPALLQRGPPLRDARDLARHLLLSSMHRPHDWPTWLAAAGISDIDGNAGIRLENSALSYQAAIDEVGVVVAQAMFVQDDLRARRLVEPFRLRAATDWAYTFAYPVDRPKPPSLELFENWLLDEARPIDQELSRSVLGAAA